MEILRDTNIDFMKYRKFWIVVSLALVLVGLFSVFVHGNLNVGVDFAGGTQINLQFKDRPQIDRLRSVLEGAGLFPGSLHDNIAGSAPLSREQVLEAVRLAGLEADIARMPMGLDSAVTDGGSQISGGQRQRVIIARALVNRPRLLFFDEATSALDNRTQATVKRSIERMNATRIIVAHRLSTIVNAHRIFVMEGGQLVQTGTYAELMAVKGPFAELAKRQIA